MAGGQATTTTSLVVTSNTLGWSSSFLGQKKDKGTDYAAKDCKQASNFFNKKSSAKQAKELAYQKEEAKDTAGEAKEARRRRAPRRSKPPRRSPASKHLSGILHLRFLGSWLG